MHLSPSKTNKSSPISLITHWQNRINHQLDHYLNQTHGTISPLKEAMHYSVLNGGKRIRPLLVYAIGTDLGATENQLDPAACAIECIHAYSLVHDDLPAMDNDALRRGKPTCHKAFCEAIAILTGDALQSLAFDIITTPTTTLPAETILKMTHCLARAIGRSGMVSGQVIDLALNKEKSTSYRLKQMHQLKTGELIQACIQLGILAAGTPYPTLTNHFQKLGESIGLLFQIQDDVFDSKNHSENLNANYCVSLGKLKTQESLDALKSNIKNTVYQITTKSSSLKINGLKQWLDYVLNRTY